MLLWKLLVNGDAIMIKRRRKMASLFFFFHQHSLHLGSHHQPPTSSSSKWSVKIENGNDILCLVLDFTTKLAELLFVLTFHLYFRLLVPMHRRVEHGMARSKLE